jgi:hypothetical protein
MRGTLEREVERHFTGKAVATGTTDSNNTTAAAATAGASAGATAGVVSQTRPPAAASATLAVRKASVTNSDSTATAAAALNSSSSSGDSSAMLSDADLYSGRVVGSLFRVLQTHMDRKDIVRAGMRSLSNLVRLEPIRSALLQELARCALTIMHSFDLRLYASLLQQRHCRYHRPSYCCGAF